MAASSSGISELRRLGIALSQAGGAGKPVRAAAREVMLSELSRMEKAARDAARAIPTKGGHPRPKKGEDPPPPLRRTLAKSVGHKLLFSARTDVCEVRGIPNRMGSGRYNLGAYLEGAPGTRPWRHPYFGNRNLWFTNQPHPWFYPAVDPLLPEAALAMQAAVVSALETIERISQL